MEAQQEVDYKRIEKAIEFLKQNFKTQPSLEQAAEKVNLSPFHFQRMFQHWAGVSPKQFLQYLSAKHAKAILKQTGASLSDTAFETGLSGTGRLHDLFIKIEGMTPGEYKNGGELLVINYSFFDSPFGQLLVGSTAKGISYMAFADDSRTAALDLLFKTFPNASYKEQTDQVQEQAVSVFRQDWQSPAQIRLHLKGTPFQIKVWETLLKIPAGGLTTYAELAATAGHKGASRAVGTAVGHNPIALLIPCHRVIKATGETGQYHWGNLRKQAIIGWEAAKS